MSPENGDRDQNNLLGLSTKEVAGLTVEELTGNDTAIRMMLHYYVQLVNENNSLKNDNNTLKTYVTAYDNKKSNAAAGAILLSISNVSIGFGVNLLSVNNFWPGISSLAIGLSLIAGGIYFSFLKDRN